AEEGAEAVELKALQGHVRPAATDRHGVVRRDPVDLDRIEFVESLALEQGQGSDVVKGIAEVGEQKGAAVRLRQGEQGVAELLVDLAVQRAEVEQAAER